MSIPRYDKKLSYTDYLSWSGDEPIEIINGIPHNMSPGPSTKHQQVSMNLSYQLMNFFISQNCQVFAAPFDVRLFSAGKSDDEVFHVVQPDISVICDENKLDEKGCAGSPDLIIEILSPSSAKMDKMKKRNLYERAHVKEYWIVDPLNELVEVYHLDKNELYGKPLFFSTEDTVESFIFKELKIEVGEVF
ncbi:Uma2 family endonuclease [Oceanobacillus damuensis]|uniref:Uma2 family endonuclease n=1 Tax=Oceanobacillus damuensis TaxID=937928 RepID=UPI00082AA72C|nr:Uma2 family endonuclease [Oceanobacillus damuensis]